MQAQLIMKCKQIISLIYYQGMIYKWVILGIALINSFMHGLLTPNEGINQRYLKNWADVADEICFDRT